MNPINTKLLRQLIRTLERMEERTTCPLQQCKYTVSAYNAPGDKQALPQQRSTINVVAERSDREAKQYQTEQESNTAFQKQSLRVQRLMLVATFLAFGAAAYYASITKGQLHAMNTQNVVQERAILSIDGTASSLKYGGIGVAVKNQGHMPAKIIDYGVRYTQSLAESGYLTRYKHVNSGDIVGLENPFVIEVKVPPIPELAAKPWNTVRLDIAIQYDDGFGNMQTISSCFNPNSASENWRALHASLFRLSICPNHCQTT